MSILRKEIIKKYLIVSTIIGYFLIMTRDDREWLVAKALVQSNSNSQQQKQ